MPVYVNKMTTEVIQEPVPMGRDEPEEERTQWSERDRVRAAHAQLERDRRRLSGEAHE